MPVIYENEQHGYALNQISTTNVDTERSSIFFVCDSNYKVSTVSESLAHALSDEFSENVKY